MGAFRRICLLALLAACCFGSTPALAEERVALVIGNGAYKNLPRLDNTVGDAQAMSELLKSVGFKVTLGTDLTREKMTALMREFGKTTADADIALVYYAGTGVALDDSEYFLPVDAGIKTESDIRLGATIDLNAAIDQILWPANVKLVFVDAPRTNPFPGRMTACHPALPGPREPSGEPSPENSFIVFATGPGQEILDGEEGSHRPFTQALLENIAVPGVEIGEMMTKVRARVTELTNKGQMPWGSSNLITLVYLNPNPPAPAGAK
jgi:uncharacterized caspase-like protein